MSQIGALTVASLSDFLARSKRVLKRNNIPLPQQTHKIKVSLSRKRNFTGFSRLALETLDEPHSEEAVISGPLAGFHKDLELLVAEQKLLCEKDKIDRQLAEKTGGLNLKGKGKRKQLPRQYRNVPQGSLSSGSGSSSSSSLSNSSSSSMSSSGSSSSSGSGSGSSSSDSESSSSLDSSSGSTGSASTSLLDELLGSDDLVLKPKPRKKQKQVVTKQKSKRTKIKAATETPHSQATVLSSVGILRDAPVRVSPRARTRQPVRPQQERRRLHRRRSISPRSSVSSEDVKGITRGLSPTTQKRRVELAKKRRQEMEAAMNIPYADIDDSDILVPPTHGAVAPPKLEDRLEVAATLEAQTKPLPPAADELPTSAAALALQKKSMKVELDGDENVPKGVPPVPLPTGFAPTFLETSTTVDPKPRPLSISQTDEVISPDGAAVQQLPPSVPNLPRVSSPPRHIAGESESNELGIDLYTDDMLQTNTAAEEYNRQIVAKLGKRAKRVAQAPDRKGRSTDIPMDGSIPVLSRISRVMARGVAEKKSIATTVTDWHKRGRLELRECHRRGIRDIQESFHRRRTDVLERRAVSAVAQKMQLSDTTRRAAAAAKRTHADHVDRIVSEMKAKVRSQAGFLDDAPGQEVIRTDGPSHFKMDSEEAPSAADAARARETIKRLRSQHSASASPERVVPSALEDRYRDEEAELMLGIKDELDDRAAVAPGSVSDASEWSDEVLMEEIELVESDPDSMSDAALPDGFDLAESDVDVMSEDELEEQRQLLRQLLVNEEVKELQARGREPTRRRKQVRGWHDERTYRRMIHNFNKAVRLRQSRFFDGWDRFGCNANADVKEREAASFPNLNDALYSRFILSPLIDSSRLLDDEEEDQVIDAHDAIDATVELAEEITRDILSHVDDTARWLHTERVESICCNIATLNVVARKPDALSSFRGIGSVLDRRAPHSFDWAVSFAQHVAKEEELNKFQTPIVLPLPPSKPTEKTVQESFGRIASLLNAQLYSVERATRHKYLDTHEFDDVHHLFSPQCEWTCDEEQVRYVCETRDARVAAERRADIRQDFRERKRNTCRALVRARFYNEQMEAIYSSYQKLLAGVDCSSVDNDESVTRALAKVSFLVSNMKNSLFEGDAFAACADGLLAAYHQEHDGDSLYDVTVWSCSEEETISVSDVDDEIVEAEYSKLYMSGCDAKDGEDTRKTRSTRASPTEGLEERAPCSPVSERSAGDSGGEIVSIHSDDGEVVSSGDEATAKSDADDEVPTPQPVDDKSEGEITDTSEEEGGGHDGDDALGSSDSSGDTYDTYDDELFEEEIRLRPGRDPYGRRTFEDFEAEREYENKKRRYLERHARKQQQMREKQEAVRKAELEKQIAAIEEYKRNEVEKIRQQEQQTAPQKDAGPSVPPPHSPSPTLPDVEAIDDTIVGIEIMSLNPINLSAMNQQMTGKEWNEYRLAQIKRIAKLPERARKLRKRPRRQPEQIVTALHDELNEEEEDDDEEQDDYVYEEWSGEVERGPPVPEKEITREDMAGGADNLVSDIFEDETTQERNKPYLYIGKSKESHIAFLAKKQKEAKGFLEVDQGDRNADKKKMVSELLASKSGSAFADAVSRPADQQLAEPEDENEADRRPPEQFLMGLKETLPAFGVRPGLGEASVVPSVSTEAQDVDDPAPPKPVPSWTNANEMMAYMKQRAEYVAWEARKFGKKTKPARKPSGSRSPRSAKKKRTLSSSSSDSGDDIEHLCVDSRMNDIADIDAEEMKIMAEMVGVDEKQVEVMSLVAKKTKEEISDGTTGLGERRSQSDDVTPTRQEEGEVESGRSTPAEEGERSNSVSPLPILPPEVSAPPTDQNLQEQPATDGDSKDRPAKIIWKKGVSNLAADWDAPAAEKFSDEPLKKKLLPFIGKVPKREKPKKFAFSVKSGVKRLANTLADLDDEIDAKKAKSDHPLVKGTEMLDDSATASCVASSSNESFMDEKEKCAVLAKALGKGQVRYAAEGAVIGVSDGVSVVDKERLCVAPEASVKSEQPTATHSLTSIRRAPVGYSPTTAAAVPAGTAVRPSSERSSPSEPPCVTAVTTPMTVAQSVTSSVEGPQLDPQTAALAHSASAYAWQKFHFEQQFKARFEQFGRLPPPLSGPHAARPSPGFFCPPRVLPPGMAAFVPQAPRLASVPLPQWRPPPHTSVSPIAPIPHHRNAGRLERSRERPAASMPLHPGTTSSVVSESLRVTASSHPGSDGHTGRPTVAPSDRPTQVYLHRNGDAVNDEIARISTAEVSPTAEGSPPATSANAPLGPIDDTEREPGANDAGGPAAVGPRPSDVPPPMPPLPSAPAAVGLPSSSGMTSAAAPPGLSPLPPLFRLFDMTRPRYPFAQRPPLLPNRPFLPPRPHFPYRMPARSFAPVPGGPSPSAQPSIVTATSVTSGVRSLASSQSLSDASKTPEGGQQEEPMPSHQGQVSPREPAHSSDLIMDSRIDRPSSAPAVPGEASAAAAADLSPSSASADPHAVGDSSPNAQFQGNASDFANDDFLKNI